MLEGEGGKIGRIFLPSSMATAIRTGLPVLVSASLESRTERILREYAPAGWDAADKERFCRGLDLMSDRLPPQTLVSLETAFDDGRFVDVVRGLLVEYYDPLYRRSCVDGRRFVMNFETGPDSVQDARRFIRDISRLI